MHKQGRSNNHAASVIHPALCILGDNKSLFSDSLTHHLKLLAYPGDGQGLCAAITVKE